MKISFEGTHNDIIEEMAEYLNEAGVAEVVAGVGAGATAGGNGTEAPPPTKGKRGRPAGAKNAAAPAAAALPPTPAGPGGLVTLLCLAHTAYAPVSAPASLAEPARCVVCLGQSTSRPTAPAPTGITEAELKQALTALVKHANASGAEEFLKTTFGATSARTIPPDRWGEFVSKVATLTAPAQAPAGANLF